MSTPIETTTNTQAPRPATEPQPCWFCEGKSTAVCRCGRAFCTNHNFTGHCLVCSLGLGLFDRAGVPEPVSELITLSMSAAAHDPYIVVPPRLQNVKPMPLLGAEKMLAAVMQMLQSEDPRVRHRAAVVLASTTNSWPTMDPSQLVQHKYGTGTLCLKQVRAWILYALKISRVAAYEATSVAILDRLRTADFRDMYPSVADNLKMLAYTNLGTRVHDMFHDLGQLYPTRSYRVNERYELFVYEQYVNRQRGAGATLERIYGDKLRFDHLMVQMLKKGVVKANYARFLEWYPGQAEPV
jgi:hypothetical protein